MQATVELAETMYLLAKGTTVEKAKYVVLRNTVLLFSTLEKYYQYHDNLKLTGEDSAVVMKSWEISLAMAGYLKASGATHVTIDPKNANFLSFSIDTLIRDLKSLALYGKVGFGSSFN